MAGSAINLIALVLSILLVKVLANWLIRQVANNYTTVAERLKISLAERDTVQSST